MLKAGWTIVSCSGLCPVGFWVSPSMETLPVLWATCSDASLAPQGKRFFLSLNRIFYISIFGHCFLSCHWIPMRRVCLSLVSLIRCLYKLVGFPGDFSSSDLESVILCYFQQVCFIVHKDLWIWVPNFSNFCGLDTCSFCPSCSFQYMRSYLYENSVCSFLKKFANGTISCFICSFLQKLKLVLKDIVPILLG